MVFTIVRHRFGFWPRYHLPGAVFHNPRTSVQTFGHFLIVYHVSLDNDPHDPFSALRTFVPLNEGEGTCGDRHIAWRGITKYLLALSPSHRSNPTQEYVNLFHQLL